MRSLGVSAVAAILAACATAGEAAPDAPVFRGVRKLALVRVVEDRPGRARDPLDGLEETLRQRGFETRRVELARRRNPPELAALERLLARLELRAATPRSERLGVRGAGDAGAEAGAAVRGLGVDAVAAYHRLERRRAPALEPALRGRVAPAPAAPEAGPLAALSLVDGTGRVATFPWGEATALEDPTAPLNAAEAIDLLVRALTGEPPLDDGGRSPR